MKAHKKELKRLILELDEKVYENCDHLVEWLQEAITFRPWEIKWSETGKL